MIRTVLVSAVALALSSAGAWAADATGTRAWSGVSTKEGALTGLPGQASGYRYSPEKREAGPPVDADTVEALRRQAIAAGQTSTSGGGEKQQLSEQERKVIESAVGNFRARVRARAGE